MIALISKVRRDAANAVRRAGKPIIITIAATIGANVTRRRSISGKVQIDDPDNSETEDERVGLQVPDLHETKQGTKAPGRAAASAHDGGINNPAIDEPGDAGEKSLGGVNQSAIKFIEIEFVAKQIDGEWVFEATAIENNRAGRSKEHGDEGDP